VATTATTTTTTTTTIISSIRLLFLNISFCSSSACLRNKRNRTDKHHRDLDGSSRQGITIIFINQNAHKQVDTDKPCNRPKHLGLPPPKSPRMPPVPRPRGQMRRVRLGRTAGYAHQGGHGDGGMVPQIQGMVKRFIYKSRWDRVCSMSSHWIEVIGVVRRCKQNTQRDAKRVVSGASME
jgi:hypothetical protein